MWPAYPRYEAGSCWTRPFPQGPPLRVAPSSPLAATPARLRAATVAHRLLARLGDSRYVHGVNLGRPPAVTLTHLKGYYAGARPPVDAVWAYVDAPAVSMVAQWEAALVVGALRDDLCANGGVPLVGWTIGRAGLGLSDRTQALEQRFPNPSPSTFRQRVRLAGRKYGFTVSDLRLLHPRQLAPLVVVESTRDRKAFVKDVPAIVNLLDPVSTSRAGTAVTFEGFFFEARDDHGAFVRVENVHRGETEGGQWSWNRCFYPYGHSMPAGSKPCP